MYALPAYHDISVILPALYRPAFLLGTDVVLNTDLFPWTSFGYFAGDYPAGITTLEGVPTNARITVLARAPGMRWDATPVRRAESGTDGIWRADGIEPGLRYRIIGDKEGYNSVIADNVAPMNLPRALPNLYEVVVAAPLDLAPRLVGGVGESIVTSIDGALPQGVFFSGGKFTASWPTGPLGDYPVILDLEDESEQVNQSLITLRLILLPLVFEGVVSGTLDVGEVVNDTNLVISGGEPPHSLSVSAGALPPGLSLSGTVISGETTAPGVYNFTLKAADVRGNEQTRNYVVSVGPDQHAASVVALMRFNDSLVDDRGTTWTASGGVSFGTGGAVSGKAISFNGGYIQRPYTSDFDWWVGDFTLECFITFRGGGSSNAGSLLPTLIGCQEISGPSNYWSFGPDFNNKLRMYYWNGTQNTVVSTERVPLNVRTHIALVVSAGKINLFVGGVGLATPVNISGTPQSSASVPLAMGKNPEAQLDASVDELRITKGVARYTGNFVPPTSRHPSI